MPPLMNKAAPTAVVIAKPVNKNEALFKHSPDILMQAMSPMSRPTI